jgi:primase-polymerase (primpol)-like protein
MPNWVAWRWQRSQDGEKWTKPPFRAAEPDQHAANNKPETWDTRSAAVAAVLADKANGVGFVLTGTDIGAIDLDKCRNPETQKVERWAQKILKAARRGLS